jgi:hypothetical protein
MYAQAAVLWARAHNFQAVNSVKYGIGALLIDAVIISAILCNILCVPYLLDVRSCIRYIPALVFHSDKPILDAYMIKVSFA